MEGRSISDESPELAAARAAYAAHPADAGAAARLALALENAGRGEAGRAWSRAGALAPADPRVALREALWNASADRLESADAAFARLMAAGPARALSPAETFVAAALATRLGAFDAALALARADPALAPRAALVEWLREALATARAAVRADRDIVVSVAGWGARFADLFARMALASALEPGNLPALLAGRRPLFHFVCDAPFRARLEADPLFPVLTGLGPVAFVDLPARVLAGNHPDDVYGPAQHPALAAARDRRIDYLYLHTDALYAAGAFGRLRARIESGAYDAFCTAGLSADRDAMLAAADAARAPGGTLALAARRMVSLAWARPHPRGLAALVRADLDTIPDNPSMLLFADGETLRMRVLQPGPIWIAARVWSPATRFVHSTSDDGLLARVFRDPNSWDRILFAVDSDEFGYIDLAPPEDVAAKTGRLPANGDPAAALFALAAARRMLGPLRARAFLAECVMRGDAPPPWPSQPPADATISALARRLAAANLP